MKKWQSALMVLAALAVVAPFIIKIQSRLSQAQAQAQAQAQDEERPRGLAALAESAKRTGLLVIEQSGAMKTTVIIHSAKTWQSDENIAIPTAGNAFFVVDLSLRNDSDRRYTLIPLDQCSVKTSDGRIYKAVAQGPKPRLRRRTMMAGDEARGYVCFEVPADESLDSLVWLFRAFPL